MAAETIRILWFSTNPDRLASYPIAGIWSNALMKDKVTHGEMNLLTHTQSVYDTQSDMIKAEISGTVFKMWEITAAQLRGFEILGYWITICESTGQAIGLFSGQIEGMSELQSQICISGSRSSYSIKLSFRMESPLKIVALLFLFSV